MGADGFLRSEAARTRIVRRGAGIPLVFVHGNGVDHRLLLELDDVFAEPDGWERIYLDLPGFGATPALQGRGGLPDLADWLDRSVAGIVGSRPFGVIGNSMGGLLARDLVARRAEQCLGMALLAPVVDPVRAHRVLPAPEIVRADEGLLASMDPVEAEIYAEMAVVRSPENLARFRRAALPGIRVADEGAMRRLGEQYVLESPPDDLLAGFARPVLIIAGKQDVVVGYEDQCDLSRAFPRSTYAALDAAGHNVHLDQPDAVRALLRVWLQAVAASRT